MLKSSVSKQTIVPPSIKTDAFNWDDEAIVAKLKLFCEKEFSTENFHFMTTFKSLKKKLNSKELSEKDFDTQSVELIREICHVGLKQLNLPDLLKKELLSLLTNSSHSALLASLEKVEAEIQNLMDQDTLRRFAESLSKNKPSISSTPIPTPTSSKPSSPSLHRHVKSMPPSTSPLLANKQREERSNTVSVSTTRNWVRAQPTKWVTAKPSSSATIPTHKDENKGQQYDPIQHLDSIIATLEEKAKKKHDEDLKKYGKKMLITEAVQDKNFLPIASSKTASQNRLSSDTQKRKSQEIVSITDTPSTTESPTKRHKGKNSSKQ